MTLLHSARERNMLLSIILRIFCFFFGNLNCLSNSQNLIIIIIFFWFQIEIRRHNFQGKFSLSNAWNQGADKEKFTNTPPKLKNRGKKKESETERKKAKSQMPILNSSTNNHYHILYIQQIYICSIRPLLV